jgi:hypothetical protein
MLWPRNFNAVSPEVKGRTVYSFFNVDNIEFNIIGSSSTVRMTGMAVFSDTMILYPKPIPRRTGTASPAKFPQSSREVPSPADHRGVYFHDFHEMAAPERQAG